MKAELQQFLQPGQEFSNRHPGEISPASVEDYKRQAQAAAEQAGIVAPERHPYVVYLGSASDDLELRLELAYNPRLLPAVREIWGSEIVFSSGKGFLNEISLFLEDLKYGPWITGSFLSDQDLRRVTDYNPNDAYLLAINVLIKRRAERGLFRPVDPFHRTIPLPQ